MLASSMFSTATPEKTNPFLTPPTELTKEAGNTAFKAFVARRGGSFTDGIFPYHDRKILLIMHWETRTLYRNVQYMQLPDEFTDDERALFVEKTTTINGQETKIYEHERGRESGLFEDRIANIQRMSEKTTEENKLRMRFKQIVRTDTPKQSSIKDCSDFILHNKVLFYVGAGISADTLPTNQAIFKKVGYTPHASYDPFIKMLLNNPEQLIEKGFMFDWGTHLANNPSPSLAHNALVKLAQLTGSQVVTTNSDPYLEKGGLKPYCLWDENFREYWTPETIKQVKAVITFGCAEDAVGFLGMYRHYNPEGRIIALNIEAPKYNDLLVEGDVQETLPARLKLTKYNKSSTQDAPQPMVRARL